jgi:Fe-S-cluster containining protein
MGGFVDGDDLCAGCGICCRRVEGLMVTGEELARLPLLAPHVTGGDGVFHRVDMPGGCPYLAADGRCGVFASRPFDCSLFPVHLHAVEGRAGGEGVTAVWRYGGAECPNRWEFASRMGQEQWVELRGWVGRATGAADVRLRQDSARRARTRAQLALHRMGVLRRVRRLAGRPLPTKPGAAAGGA